MDKIKTTPINVEPYFDLEDFLNFSHESRIEGDTLQALVNLWEGWLKLLQVQNLEGRQNSWLAVWLPQEVEQAIDAAWEESPSKGFLLNNLAQYMCMTAIQQLLPQAANGGCAPSPAPNADLQAALGECGLAGNEPGGHLLRRYAVLTYFPFKGGCEICNLRASCPKGSGNDNFASIVLPGYERGASGKDEG